MREEFITAASCHVGRVFEFDDDGTLVQATQAVLTLPDGTERVVDAFGYGIPDGQDAHAPGVRLFLDPPGDDGRALFVAVPDIVSLTIDSPPRDVAAFVDPNDDDPDEEWYGDDVEFNDGC